MHLCNRVIFRFTVALFAALGFSACIMDDVDAPLDPVTAQKIAKLNGSTLYIRLFSDGELTRANSEDLQPDENPNDHETGDLVNGSEMEHRIDPKGGHFIIFFDKNEKFYSIADLAEVNLSDRKDYDHDEDGDGKNDHIREVIFGARVTPDEDKEELPAWCLVVLNGGGLLDATAKTIMGDALTNKTISDVLKYSWKAAADENLYTIGTDLTKREAFGYGRNSNGYFVMTNAVYVHTDKEGNSGVFTAVPIDTGDPNNPDDTGMFQFGDFDPKKILFIHVERMLAKYDFGIKVDWDKYKGTVGGNNTEYFQPSDTPDVVLFEKFLEADDVVNQEDIGSPKYVAQKWMIQITGWAINALERSSYLFKHLNDDLKYEDNYKGSPAWEMNGPNGWNDQKNYRSYWAEDLTYDDDKYPWQYRYSGWAKDEVPWYSTDGNVVAPGVTRLKNYSYNELEFNVGDPGEESKRIEGLFARAIYAPESTYDAAAVRGDANNPTRHDGRDELLAASHLLVGARLLITKESNEDYEARDVFRDRNGFFYLTERDVFAVFCHSVNQLLTSQQSMDFTYYRWSNNNDQMYDLNKDTPYTDGLPYWKPNWNAARNMENGDKLAAKPADFSHYYNDNDGNPYNNNPLTPKDPYNGNYKFGLYWVDNGQYTLLDDEFFRTKCPDQATFKTLFGALAIGNIPSGDGQRLPWPAEIASTGKLAICNTDHVSIYIFTRDHDQALRPTARKELRFASDNDIKSILYEWVGAIDHFNEGRMYYAHGIEQASSRVVKNGETTVKDEEDRPLSLTGRFGAVRNNWYQLRLTRINSLGVPVDDPGQPIVPDRATPHDQINVTVSIQDWHTESSKTPTAGTQNNPTD